ncbi:MAG: hypothetical protein KDC34_06945 [Saprospiraceae bacterium]|nr:hypothetical protein [Saprospiraceae bacterium]
MQKLITILCLFLFSLSIQAQDTLSFLESWSGIYVGTLDIYGPKGLAQSLPMELHILPIEGSENYSWLIIYGEDKVEGARDYIIEPTDPSTGLYTIDEQNTIRIEGYLRGNVYAEVFTVAGSQIIVTTEKLEDGNLLWEILANSTEPVSSTGNEVFEEEEIPEVLTFPVSVYQRALLKKQD